MQLLLGPTYGAHKVLNNMGLTMQDIGVFEIHEAFAGQVLSNLNAMSSQAFADKAFNGKVVGEVNQDKVRSGEGYISANSATFSNNVTVAFSSLSSQMNTKGGSLSLGHPFGATGSRLVSTAANRLQREEERFALLAACADGGLGHACILERYDN